MGKNDKLICIAHYNTDLNKIINADFSSFGIYRSKGLLEHLKKRNHFVAVQYIDYLPDIINNPDYAGVYNGNIELVKIYKNNIFISIKLDNKKGHYYVATAFEVKQSKIDSYVRSGRLHVVNKKLQYTIDNNT